MRVNLMIEGQEGVTWAQWLALAEACERHGFEGLFRSDHYGATVADEARDALDAWTTLAGLAAVTDRIRLGTLVSPVTFRHPSLLAKAAVTVDHISGGRAELGIGAGWNEREHVAYGFALPDVETRFELLEEQLEVIHGQWSEERFSYDGRHYTIEDLTARPAPLQNPHPNLIVGGRAGSRGARLAARWADEYNTLICDVPTLRERRATLERAWEEAGRDPASLTLSFMTGCIVGVDRDEVRERARRVLDRVGRDTDPDEYLDRLAGLGVAGTPDEVVARLGELGDAGVDRVMLQHLVHEDLEMVALLGEEVLPQLP